MNSTGVRDAGVGGGFPVVSLGRQITARLGEVYGVALDIQTVVEVFGDSGHAAGFPVEGLFEVGDLAARIASHVVRAYRLVAVQDRFVPGFDYDAYDDQDDAAASAPVVDVAGLMRLLRERLEVLQQVGEIHALDRSNRFFCVGAAVTAELETVVGLVGELGSRVDSIQAGCGAVLVGA